MIVVTVDDTVISCNDNEFASWVQCQRNAMHYILETNDRKHVGKYSFGWVLSAYVFGIFIMAMAQG